jgi:integrase/SAM-dependent methyltransferase
VTREEAERLMAAALDELPRDATGSGGETLAQYGERWLDDCDRRGLRCTPSRRSKWRRHIATSAMAGWPIRTITRSDVREWVETLMGRMAADRGHARRRRARRLAPGQIRNILGVLRACMGSAVEREIIRGNPTTGIRVPRTGHVTPRWTYLDPDEQRRLTESPVVPEPLRLMIAVAIGTGLRAGEQWTLHLADVVVDGLTPHIIVRHGGRAAGQYLPPKAGRTRRVPLLDAALGAMRRWMEVLPDYAPLNPHGLVFPGSQGGHRTTHDPPAGWYEALDALRIRGVTGALVRWHDLRHTCASSLVSGWWGRLWPLEQIRDLLGHANLKTTERYAHLAPGALDDAARATPGLPAIGSDTGLRDVSIGNRVAPGGPTPTTTVSRSAGLGPAAALAAQQPSRAARPISPYPGHARRRSSLSRRAEASHLTARCPLRCLGSQMKSSAAGRVDAAVGRFTPASAAVALPMQSPCHSLAHAISGSCAPTEVAVATTSLAWRSPIALSSLPFFSPGGPPLFPAAATSLALSGVLRISPRLLLRESPITTIRMYATGIVMGYDEDYASIPHLFGAEPDPLLELFAPLIDCGARVLDIGAGQGRHALYLARRGIDVDALEPSRVAAATLREASRRGAFPIRVVAESFDRFEPDEDGYGAVLVFGLIQILTWAEIDELLERVRRWARPGGLVFATAFTVRDAAFARHAAEWQRIGRNSFRSESGEVRTYLRPGEALDLFAGFATVHHEQRLGPVHRHGDGPEERHARIEYVGRRAC